MYHNTLIIRSLEINFQFTQQGLSFEKHIKIRSMSQHKSKLTHLNIELSKSVKKRQRKEEKVKKYSCLSLSKSCIFMKYVNLRLVMLRECSGSLHQQFYKIFQQMWQVWKSFFIQKRSYVKKITLFTFQQMCQLAMQN